MPPTPECLERACDLDRFFFWMAIAATLFLGATLVWGVFLIPKIVTRLKPSPRAKR